MSSSNPVSVVLVDDHTVVRHAIRELLETSAALSVQGEAGSVDDGIAMISATLPQVAVVDLDLGEESGLQIIAACKAPSPATRYLMLSAHGTAEHLRRSLAAGAHGYLLKGVTAGQLIDGILKIGGGETVLDPALVPMLVDQLTDPGAPTRALTVREHEVLALVAEGNTAQWIGERLGISPRTVQKHIESIYQKLGVSNRAELIQQAFRSGLLE